MLRTVENHLPARWAPQRHRPTGIGLLAGSVNLGKHFPSRSLPFVIPAPSLSLCLLALDRSISYQTVTDLHSFIQIMVLTFGMAGSESPVF